jgi:hypothetical protein
MSALGPKQTFAPQKAMSALPSIADIGSAQAHLRFVPNLMDRPSVLTVGQGQCMAALIVPGALGLDGGTFSWNAPSGEELTERTRASRAYVE